MAEQGRAQLGLAWLVAQRELRDQFRDWRIIVPMILLTIFFPFLMNSAAKMALDFTSQYGTPLVAERLVPFFLMIVGFFPITVSLVIALEAFVGEKERGTIEPLLSSPLRDWQIYLGKLVAASTVPLVTAYMGIAVYMLLLYIRQIPFPDLNIILQTISLTTVQAVLMVSGAIVISTQSTSVRAANLMSSFVVIPMALLIQGESIMLFWGNNQVLWLAVLGVAVLAFLLVRLGIAHFQREALLGREIDVLNLRWMAQTFWHSFKGPAQNILEWYRRELGRTLRRQRFSILVIVLLGILALAGGYLWLTGTSADISTAISNEEFSQILSGDLEPTPRVSLGFGSIFGNNIRAVLFILLLGLFSFSVLGILAYLANMGLIGIVLAAARYVGYDPITLAVSGILPHGMFELPALILASAAVLHIGVVLVTPNADRTLGEVILEALADWIKITLGLVVPLLAIAAAIESYVTPALLLAALK
ncbi:MAG: stage II sporulation protein M [Anaerolineales bacterium]|nr:stage II sporulation protein M [Anaerolineales bacterium]